jgi:hypothetical protein
VLRIFKTCTVEEAWFRKKIHATLCRSNVKTQNIDIIEMTTRVLSFTKCQCSKLYEFGQS